MKSLFTVVLIGAAAATGALAQTAAAEAKAGEKILTELVASSEKVVKNAPFSGEAVSESVQVLADGNRIVRSSSNRLYRDSEGRFRRDGTTNSGAALGVYTNSTSITITDPVTGFKYFINDEKKTVRQQPIKAPFTFASGQYKTATAGTAGTMKLQGEPAPLSGTLKPLSPQALAELEVAAKANKAKENPSPETEAEVAKALNELKTTRAASPQASAEANIATRVLQGTLAPRASAELEVAKAGGTAAGSYLFPASESKKESLGTQTIEGVEVEGTRITSTIAAGSIGNERQIDIVYEKWYSKDLQLIVMSRHSDPRFGEQIYRLTNLSRSEPDRSLFTPPADYKVTNESVFGFTAPAAPAVPVLKPFQAPKPAGVMSPASAPAPLKKVQ